jgi:hypothetical protein
LKGPLELVAHGDFQALNRWGRFIHRVESCYQLALQLNLIVVPLRINDVSNEHRRPTFKDLHEVTLAGD